MARNKQPPKQPPPHSGDPAGDPAEGTESWDKMFENEYKAMRDWLVQKPRGDEVVITASDNSTPASSVLDQGAEDDPFRSPFDADGSPVKAKVMAADEPEPVEPDFHPEPDSTDDLDALGGRYARGVGGRLLALLRYPELSLRRAWRRSGLRAWMRSSFEWFQEYEDSRIIERSLKDDSSRSGVLNFARGNVLVTMLLVAGFSYLVQNGRSLFDTYLTPAEQTISKRYVKNDRAKAKADKAKAEKQRLAEEKARQQHQLAASQALDSCFVPASTRDTLLLSLESGGAPQSDQTRTMLDELLRFDERFRRMGLVTILKGLYHKQNIVSGLLAPALAQVSERTDQLTERRSQLLTALAENEERLRELKDPNRLNDVGVINQTIRVREEIRRITNDLREGPSSSTIDGLRRMLLEVSEAFNRPLEAAGTETTRAMQLPAWVESIPDMGEDEFREMVNRIINVELLPVSAGFSDLSATLSSYRVHRVEGLLLDLLAVRASLERAPDTQLRLLAHEQQKTNRKINSSQQGDEARQWVDYQPCIAELSLTAASG